MGKVQVSLNKDIENTLFEFLPSIKIETCPYDKMKNYSNVNWVKPVIKAQIRYTEISPNNSFRHGYLIKLQL